MSELGKEVALAALNAVGTAVQMPATDFGLLIPTEQELAVYHTMSKQAAESRFYGNLGGQAGIMSIMLYARELGVPPMIAISGGMHNIQGRIVLSAQLMGSKIRKAGHMLKTMELTMERCKIYGQRGDTGEDHESEFTLEEAEMAGLLKKDSNWMKFRKDMLYARALSRMGRQLFQDVIGSAYVEGEIEDVPQYADGGRRTRKAKLQTIVVPQGEASEGEQTQEEVQQQTNQQPQGNETSIFPESAQAPEPDPKVKKSLDLLFSYFRNTYSMTDTGIDAVNGKICEKFEVPQADLVPGDKWKELQAYCTGSLITELQEGGFIPPPTEE